MSRYIPVFQEYAKTYEWDLEELVDQAGVLSFTLSDASGRRLKVSFDSYFCYKKYDEGDAFLTLEEVRKSGGLGKYFYRVEESDFLEWFDRESCGYQRSQPMVHYRIALLNDIVDVLAIDTPKIEVES